MKNKRIVMFHPFMPETAIVKAAELLHTRWIGQGEKVDEFEYEFARKFSLPYVVSVNSGTSALRLAYAVAGIGPEDEVISTPLTAVATNTAILEQFASPVFADVQYETGNLDPNDIEHRITNKTKAIICVHYSGYPCDMTELGKIAKDHNLVLIADAAHALGAKYHGLPIATWADFTTFSFQAVKHITTVDGGMLATTHLEKYLQCKRRRWYGIDRSARKPSILGHDPTYDIYEPGYKHHMNDVAATIGIEQLKHIEHILARRKQIAARYRQELDVSGLEFFEEKRHREHSYWIFPMHIKHRMQFAEMMTKNGIEVSVGHWRNDKYSVFGGKRKDLPNMDKLDQDIICIPIHNRVTDEDVNYIINTIKKGW